MGLGHSAPIHLTFIDQFQCGVAAGYRLPWPNTTIILIDPTPALKTVSLSIILSDKMIPTAARRSADDDDIPDDDMGRRMFDADNTGIGRSRHSLV